MTIAPRPKAPRIILAILSMVALVALTQCKMTADKVTGIEKEVIAQDHAKEGRGKCVSKCAHKANEALEDERERHEENLEECEHDRACRDAENARHRAAVEKIQEERRHCIEECHHQGGGHGR